MWPPRAIRRTTPDRLRELQGELQQASTEQDKSAPAIRQAFALTVWNSWKDRMKVRSRPSPPWQSRSVIGSLADRIRVPDQYVTRGKRLGHICSSFDRARRLRRDSRELSANNPDAQHRRLAIQQYPDEKQLPSPERCRGEGDAARDRVGAGGYDERHQCRATLTALEVCWAAH